MRPRTVILATLVVSCTALAAWSYLKARTLKQALLLQEQERQHLMRRAEARDLLLQADAEVIVDGDYVKALRTMIGLRGRNEAMDVALEERIKALEDLLADRSVNDTAADPRDRLLGQYQRTIAELQAEREKLIDRAAQQHDSLHLQFEELRIDLERKQRELLRKKQVQVLAFNNTKGQKIHYLGEVRDGKANGGGVGIWTTGSVYRGQWRNNLRHGEGTFEWADGERYEGLYVDGVREGFGKYFWPSGDRFEGQWKGDRRNGQGTLYDMDGNVRYRGVWKDDKPAE